MEKKTVDFTNTETAFAYKADNDLTRAYWLFKIISLSWLVKIFPTLVRIALALRLPINGLIRATVFRHFCGGETIDQCTDTVERLGKFRIGTILDYSVEGKENESDFDNGLKQTISNIEKASQNKDIPFSVFKPTGLGRLSLYEKVSKGLALNESESSEFNRIRGRYEKIGQCAFEKGVPVFIDAEETWIQPAVDNLVTELMMKYNKAKSIIYNTVQLYRTDGVKLIEKYYTHAASNNYYLGLKLVRGAYMEKERERAQKLNYPSPIHSNKSGTDQEYNNALKFCLQKIDRVSICAGTHNEESSLLLAHMMNDYNISQHDSRIWFSQLYGMSDHISFNLSDAGYNVCKYVPYGPIRSVLPYLVRRAEENTSIAGQTGRELSLLIKERKRRKNL